MPTLRRCARKMRAVRDPQMLAVALRLQQLTDCHTSQYQDHTLMEKLTRL